MININKRNSDTESQKKKLPLKAIFYNIKFRQKIQRFCFSVSKNL